MFRLWSVSWSGCWGFLEPNFLVIDFFFFPCRVQSSDTYVCAWQAAWEQLHERLHHNVLCHQWYDPSHCWHSTYLLTFCNSIPWWSLFRTDLLLNSVVFRVFHIYTTLFCAAWKTVASFISSKKSFTNILHQLRITQEQNNVKMLFTYKDERFFFYLLELIFIRGTH